MFRKELIDLLLDQPTSVPALARLLEEHPRDVEQDLVHLVRSLRHMPYRAVIAAARCRKCGFHFHDDKLSKPGKCPRCHSTWIEPPRIHIEAED